MAFHKTSIKPIKTLTRLSFQSGAGRTFYPYLAAVDRKELDLSLFLQLHYCSVYYYWDNFSLSKPLIFCLRQLRLR